MRITIEFDADISKSDDHRLRLALWGLTAGRSGGRRKIMPHLVTLFIDGKRQKWFDDEETDSAERRARQAAEFAKRHAEWLKRQKAIQTDTER